jgi:hypothetical protein
VILGAVLQAILGLAPKAARTTQLRALGPSQLFSFAVGVNELVVLIGPARLP